MLVVGTKFLKTNSCISCYDFKANKKNNAAASYKTGFRDAGLLHSYAAAAAAIVSHAPRRFCDTIDLLELKRNHYNKETKMRKSRTTLIEKTLVQHW